MTSGEEEYEESERAAAGAPGLSGADAAAAPSAGTPALATPGPKPRGRKRRTEPILVEREDGTKEEVSPQVYRRLRRRAAAFLSGFLSDLHDRADGG